MYFFISKRARLRVDGGFFDSHKAGKSLRLVNALWALQLLQFLFVLISPAVFGIALYNGLVGCAQFSSIMEWTLYHVFTLGGEYFVNVATLIVAFYILVYILWIVNAYHAPVEF